MTARIIAVSDEIDDELATLVIAQMLYLAEEDPKADIRMIVRSPGGVVTSALGIVDTMQHVAPDVATVAVGSVSAMAVWLVAAGTPGKRFASEGARFQLLAPRGSGPLEPAGMAEFVRLKVVIYDLLAKYTGQTAAVIEQACDDRLYLDMHEAVRFGIVDHIRPAKGG